MEHDGAFRTGKLSLKFAQRFNNSQLQPIDLFTVIRIESGCHRGTRSAHGNERVQSIHPAGIVREQFV